MAFEDDLLSFQIRETIFLSSDKAGIAELKELELLPDVEVIENPAEISITGCLHLHGKYEPAGKSQGGGADTLVSTLHFTPFQLKENETSDFPLYPNEQNLTHRIPVNISIPVHRIADIGSIYAIVDSFDYQLDSERRLSVEAELKIAGIQLRDQASKTQERVQERVQEWEFVHVANDESEPEIQPASLDEIERKLAALEQEIEHREEQKRQEQARFTFPSTPYPSPVFQSPDYPPSPYFTNQDESPEGPVEADESFFTNGDESPEAPVEADAIYFSNQDESPEALVDADAIYFSNQDESPEAPVEADAIYFSNQDESPEAPVDADAIYFSNQDESPTVPLEASSSYHEHKKDSPTLFGDVTFAQHDSVIRPPEPFRFRPISSSNVIPADDGKPQETADQHEQVSQSEVQEATTKEEVTESGQHQVIEAVDQHETAEADDQPEAAEQLEEVAVETENQPEAVTAAVPEEVSEAVETEDVLAALEASETTEVHEEPPAQESKEMKVAISGKPAKEPDEGVNLSSIFSQARRSQVKQAEEETESSASAPVARKGTAPELNKSTSQAVDSLTSFVRNNDERFSKMRICIIQRNENLETIASRYSLPISRILELNNLSSDQVAEGQILYIPY